MFFTKCVLKKEGRDCSTLFECLSTVHMIPSNFGERLVDSYFRRKLDLT